MTVTENKSEKPKVIAKPGAKRKGNTRRWIFSSALFHFYIVKPCECLHREKRHNAVDKKNSDNKKIDIYKRVEHDDDKLKEWDERSTLKEEGKTRGRIKYNIYKPEDKSLRIYKLVEKGRNTEPMYFVYEREGRLT